MNEIVSLFKLLQYIELAYRCYEYKGPEPRGLFHYE
jgi:hypothetical protein